MWGLALAEKKNGLQVGPTCVSVSMSQWDSDIIGFSFSVATQAEERQIVGHQAQSALIPLCSPLEVSGVLSLQRPCEEEWLAHSKLFSRGLACEGLSFIQFWLHPFPARVTVEVQVSVCLHHMVKHLLFWPCYSSTFFGHVEIQGMSGSEANKHSCLLMKKKVDLGGDQRIYLSWSKYIYIYIC